ncbi:MAG: hypothetical protein ACOYBY_14490 [Dermatophilaceae bacterium]
MPVGTHVHRTAGVRVRRRRLIPPSIQAGLPRVRPGWATIHAAQWARTDRRAALLVCLPVQQRLVAPARLLVAWRTIRYSRRRLLLGQVIVDVCDGAQSSVSLTSPGCAGLADCPRRPARQSAGARGGSTRWSRLRLAQRLADVLDRVNQLPDFDPRHHALTVQAAELTPVERAAGGIPASESIEPDADADDG